MELRMFSIIIPIYNAEAVLEQCLKSVQNQKYEHFEVVMVDDGSKDKSGEICREYAAADARFRYIFQENKGVSSARNHGMREAQAPYLAFLDCDDRYDEAFLQRFYDLIQSKPEADHFWCGYQMCFGSTSREDRQIRVNSADQVVRTDRAKVMTLYDKQLLAAVWNKVFRTDVIRENRLQMPEDLSLGEDLLFNFSYLDCCKNTEINIIDEALYQYSCQAEDSLNTKFRADLIDIYLRLSKEMMKYLSKWQLNPGQLEKYYSAAYSMQIRSMQNLYNPLSKMPYKQRIVVCNEILKSDLFQESVKRADCYIHPLHRIAFKLADYRLVRLVDNLSKVKRSYLK